MWSRMKGEQCCPRAQEEIQSGAFWRDVLAELLATFFLVAAQCALPLGFIPGAGSDRVGTAMGMGFVVLAVGWAFGDFSGAHMNPAITMTLALRLKITFLRGNCAHIAKHMDTVNSTQKNNLKKESFFATAQLLIIQSVNVLTGHCFVQQLLNADEKLRLV